MKLVWDCLQVIELEPTACIMQPLVSCYIWIALGLDCSGPAKNNFLGNTSNLGNTGNMVL